MDKIKAFWELLHKGVEVDDPEKWKAHQITGTMLGALILALIHVAKAFGYDLPVDVDTANVIGAGVLALANVMLTVATSKRAGLPAKPSEFPVIHSDPQVPAEPVSLKPEADKSPDYHGPEYVG